jgi:4,5-dihydroxyphthalate decarboxylase
LRSKIPIELPADVHLEDAPAGTTLSDMLAKGEIDGFIGPRVPSCFQRGEPNVGWLFPDPAAAAADYFARTGIFPVMHIVGVRRTLVAQHPWLPAALLKAFEQAKAVALTRLSDTSATKVTMPFVEEQLKRTRDLMGTDYWSYGIAGNRKALETFLRHHHAQGLSSRQLTVEELFHPTTFEAFKL